MEKIDLGNNTSLTGGGLKCDAKDCNYVDVTIPISEYKNYIDYPCPNCGAPLLTQDDFDAVTGILDLAKNLGELASLSGEDLTAQPQVELSIGFNGTGNMIMDMAPKGTKMSELEKIWADNPDKDPHKLTATKMYGVPYEEVTDKMRMAAKTVDFGVMYGSSITLGELFEEGSK